MNHDWLAAAGGKTGSVGVEAAAAPVKGAAKGFRGLLGDC
jgi:hypothetical protein